LSEPAEHASALRAQALRLAEAELTSYAPVLSAPGPEEREVALTAASEPPCRIAEIAAEVASLGISVAESASAAVRGDALTGVTLASAAASAAARLVEINVGPDADLSMRAREAAERAAAAAPG
jgi:Formiminotransferase-cyclodeaminase